MDKIIAYIAVIISVIILISYGNSKGKNKKVDGCIDVDSDDDIKLVYTMEDLDRWIEEADQDEREGKTHTL
ncbi:MAG: hypothetical protein Pg6B_09490 [Candidatus Azobacteroides pseudotrichonymphae]|jgi:hypothetical protein|nr:MAG: hypothetical protein Pg6B_09490 [Candidatus Azobacteroides pseudotrichonymphae]